MKSKPALLSLLLLATSCTSPTDDKTLRTTLSTITTDYRKIIVLMDGAEALAPTDRARAHAAGYPIFWHKRRTLEDLTALLADPSTHAARLQQFTVYLT